LPLLLSFSIPLHLRRATARTVLFLSLNLLIVLLRGLNNSTANMALPKEFMIILPTLFGHYSHSEALRPSF
jgi:hypothetical protein